MRYWMEFVIVMLERERVRNECRMRVKAILRPVVRLWILTDWQPLWYDTFRWLVVGPSHFDSSMSTGSTT